MGITFGSKTAAKPKQPTVADAVASGQAFQTEIGSVYHQAKGGEFIKFGNSKNSSRNWVAVKPANYFAYRQSEPVTLLGDLNVTL